jgi:serine/threonine-protein kinase
MTDTRWQQVERVYLAALDCGIDARAALLDEACGHDSDLRREVEALLAQDPRAASFLEFRPWAAPTRDGGESARNSDPHSTQPLLDRAGLFAGRYRIVGELGTGGMGTVYRAEDVRLKRFVALKFLSAHLSMQPAARRQFLREAQAAAALDDPHVCTVFEADEHQGQAFIAMALIEGPTLKERLRSGPLPILEAVAIARGIAAGLAAAHARGVVHRDIKPGNVLLAGGRVAKITDFGLARLERSEDSTAGTGGSGTPGYMSPEQAQGLRTDRRTDIWAFGCVLHEMLTGRSPFITANGQVDVFAIVRGSPSDLKGIRPDVPSTLAAIVDRCLRRDLRRRYQSASSLLADLEAVSHDPTTAPVRLTAPEQVTPSIAVLPFADMSHDQTQEYFAEGIAEEIIHALTRIAGLRVVARTSSFAMKGRGLDARDIGRVLNVGAVLEGSVRTAGTRLRITAQLIGVEDGFHIWSERYDREASDIFAIQDEITASIVEHLRVTFHVGEPPLVRKRAPVDPEVYTLYLKGQYFFNRPSPDALQSALRYFTEASERDPSFAPAYAGVSSVWGTLANLGLLAPGEAWPKAKMALDHALALDEELPEALLNAGAMALWYDWDWTAAEACLTRVLALNPGDAYARGAYAWFLLNRRRYEECLAAVRQAITCDPLSPILYNHSVGLHVATGRPEQALADFARAIELAPNFGLPRFHASIAYALLSKYDEAVHVLETAARQGLSPGWADCALAFIRAKQGNREAVAEVRARMIRQRDEANVSPACIAWVSANLGDQDAAFAWLDRAFEERDGLMAWVHVYTDIFNPALADDPRFAALLTRLNLTDVARGAPTLA